MSLVEATAATPTENGGVPDRRQLETPQRSAEDPDYIARNKAAWERWAPKYLASGRKDWAEDELRWGMWGVSEAELRLLDGLPAGADIVELGCGAGATVAWLARRAFRPVGVDISRPLLEGAARFEREFNLSIPLLCANAEQLHFEGESFDCVISEYGASLWCSPRRWLPEASRLLRPGGRLMFVTNGALLMLCTPESGGRAGEHLVREYFSGYHTKFPGDGAVEFHLTHSHWVRLLNASGFVLENLIETRPPPGATSRYEFASLEWAQRWPSEEIWVARKAE